MKRWEAANGNTIHLVDHDRKAGKSGRRTECGKYPQREHEPWLSVPADDHAQINQLTVYYGLVHCQACTATATKEQSDD